ncbi:hypothetical protein BJX61DRAFT_540381 [Aspergillus egyptiacus]|nr:hypothetical protein BJX61DRAFT_540381 [Aspergillus egyptiacus]
MRLDQVTDYLAGIFTVFPRTLYKKNVLHAAAAHCPLFAVRMLVDAGADIYAQDQKGWSVLQYGRKARRTDTVEWITRTIGLETLAEKLFWLGCDTNYLAAANTMRPGVRVESGLLSPARSQLSSTSASSAGVLLRSASQGKRLTVANPKIPNPDDVYHPTTSLGGGTCIGRITERFEALGISLVELHPSIPFTNNEYFQAERPRRLVSSNDPAMTYGTWCTLDGMASGLVALHVSGLRAELAVRPPDAYADMTRFKIGSMEERVGKS